MRRFLLPWVLCYACLWAGESRGVGVMISSDGIPIGEDVPIEVPMDETFRSPLIGIDPYASDLFAEESSDSLADRLAELAFFDGDEVRLAAADYERIRKAIRPMPPVSVYYFGGVGFTR